MRARDETFRYLDGRMSPDEATAFEARLAGDAEAARRLEEARRIQAGVLDGAPTPPPDFAARVVRKAAAGAGTIRELDDVRRFLRRALVAAALLAALGLALVGAKLGPALLRPANLKAAPAPLVGK